MPGSVISLERACELARTGDVWLFRGSSGADRAIRSITNAPVNHVGMALVIDDLPPLMWHAELGRSLPDMWSGTHQRGVQLHDLQSAVLQWGHRYGQRGWVRQLEGPLDRAMEDAALRTVARLDGTPFPSTARLAGRWLRGRAPTLPWRQAGTDGLESAYCAEVVAVTFEDMGLLPERHRPNWYDPGRFWSGDDLDLAAGFRLGGEIEVALPLRTTPDRTAPRDRRAAGDQEAATVRRWPRISSLVSTRKRRTASSSDGS